MPTSAIGLLGAILGVCVTLLISLATVIFKMGHQSARIEELEKWRISIRIDMHEISEKMGSVGQELKRLSTLIEERTERRSATRTETKGQ